MAGADRGAVLWVDAGTIVGAAGLESSLAAARAGKRVLLANKESLVMSGTLFMETVAEAGAELDEAAVIAAISAGLARYKQPKRVLFADTLPRNVMGKVQKNVLRESYASSFEP